MRHLQLRRNSVDNIYPNREAAITFINTSLVNSVTDGEPIIARYKDDGMVTCVILGYAIVSPTETKIYIIDNSDIKEEIDRIEAAAGIDNKGNYIKNDLSRFIKEAINLNDADVKLNAVLVNTVDAVGLKTDDGTLVPFDGRYTVGKTTFKDAIESVNDVTEHTVDAVGLKADDGTLIPFVSRYVIGKDTFKSAVENESDVLTKAVDAVGLKAADGSFVDFVGKYIATKTTFKSAIESVNSVVDNTVTAVGLKDTDGTLVPFVGKYIETAPTVKKAVESLNDEIVDRLKIDKIKNTPSINLNIDLIDSSTTPTLEANLALAPSTGTSGNGTNIIKTNTNGVFANVFLSYNQLDNSLQFENGVEITKMTLNAGSIIDNMVYKPETEELIITYHTTSSADPLKVVIPLADLITEYKYLNTTTDITYDGGKGNVLFKVTRKEDGQSEIVADVNIIDCGTY